MARQRMVTRTITTLNACAIILNKETGEIIESVKSFSNGTTENKMLKTFNEEIPEGFKALAIKEIKETSKYYGMTELEFISLAKEIAQEQVTETPTIEE